jgi:hypothetical protein
MEIGFGVWGLLRLPLMMLHQRMQARVGRDASGGFQ